MTVGSGTSRWLRRCDLGKGSTGPSEAVQEGMLSNETALVGIAKQQAANAEQLYGIAEPGFKTAENFYQTLASGDPSAIMRAIAPTAQAASESAAGAKSNILQTAPAGGEKNLALEMTDVNRGALIGKTISGATTGAPNALAQLAGQGVGESIASAGAGVSAYGTGNQALQGLGQMQIEGQQIQAEEKGNMLGAVAGLGGAAMGL